MKPGSCQSKSRNKHADLPSGRQAWALIFCYPGLTTSFLNGLKKDVYHEQGRTNNSTLNLAYSSHRTKKTAKSARLHAEVWCMAKTLLSSAYEPARTISLIPVNYRLNRKPTIFVRIKLSSLKNIWTFSRKSKLNFNLFCMCVGVERHFDVCILRCGD